MNKKDELNAVEYLEDLSDYNENILFATAVVVLVLTLIYLAMKRIKSG